MMPLQPAYLVAYIDAENPPRFLPLEFRGGAQVVVRSYSLDGRVHFGEPKPLAYDKLPLFLFQLIDADYYIEPSQNHHIAGVRVFHAFSPEFVNRNLTKQVMEQSDENPR